MSDEVYQGQNKDIVARLRDGNDDPYDLTGKQIIAQYKSNSVVTNKTCSISGNSLLGKVLISFTDSETLLLKKGDFPIAIYVGTYAAPPVINPPVDVTNQIWNIQGQITVLEPKV